ncbi:MAR-binding filament-like protein 1-1 isoform 2 [Hibiscus syriacus]|uniref:MAR-binding filament-like protein 1-1 isoform 2 n=1 Tax=Hibiscus syriacus TaxID=106335 RepID=A0A6A3C4Q2_HIBSY|nr:MAR-binding filament-like protein 1-1 isoform 2 [Hibiscus syriacus]
MPYLLHVHPNQPISFLGISGFPFLQPSRTSSTASFMRGTALPRIFYKKEASLFLQNELNNTRSKKLTPFGYTRKDVLLIGLGVTVIGFGLKSGLEFVGVDPLQAGNVVQLVMVLGLTIGWISTYIFRVSNKEMTQKTSRITGVSPKSPTCKIVEKRLEGLTEAELVALLEQVEEEKRQQARGEQVN